MNESGGWRVGEKLVDRMNIFGELPVLIADAIRGTSTLKVEAETEAGLD